MKLKLGQVEITDQTNILEIEVPEEMKVNTPTGFKYMDRLFAGDGVTPSTAALITGTPGSGKTTLMLQLADSLTKEGHLALFNTGEESLYQVSKVAERLRLRHGFIVGQDRDISDILTHLAILQKEAADKKSIRGGTCKVFLFQDSLQCLDVPHIDKDGKPKKGRPMSGDKASIIALEQLIHWAKETFNFAFIIGQVNKSGDFSGKNSIKHMVDCHLHLGWEIDKNGAETPIAEMTKNRFGPGGLYYGFELTETGLKFEETK